MAPVSRHFQEDQRGGFALVLALSVMAFTIMLLLSMSLLIRVETTNNNQALAQLRAKEGARLALMMALGDLQRHAGPDQRVTARAEILGRSVPEVNRMWTGVWDSSNPSASPTWLVSKATIVDVYAPPTDPLQIEQGFDQDGNGLFADTPDEYAPTQVPFIKIDSSGNEIAWWISDEGVKAPMQITDGIAEKVEALADGELYLDYNGKTNHTIPALHDPAFDFRELVDVSDGNNPLIESIQRIHRAESLGILTASFDDGIRTGIDAQMDHSATLSNAFVLSDPANGGLKKDLSFLKTLSPTSTTQADLDQIYGDGLLTPAAIELIHYRANPTAYPTEEIMGMKLPYQTVQEAEADKVDFTLAPIITEFQLAAGVAADGKDASLDVTTDSPLYFVYKVYLELWNPYTIPMRIGDPALASNLGFSDIKVVIGNLPDLTITNNDSPTAQVQGSLGEISLLWSDSPSPKTLRPGMVYLQTLPTDAYQNDKGAIVDVLTTTPATISGTRRQTYTGDFTFNGPLEITLYGIDSNLNEREIFFSEITYPNFVIHYDGDSNATRFKRQLSIQSGATGITKESIEQPGYAFGFRFKMLDEQESLGTVHDISNWLSRFDIRNRHIKVDLDQWDIEDAWTSTPPLPYDFDSSASGYDPSDFDHSEGFKDDDFFTYNASGGGRMDRIARFIDLPTSEITNVGIFRSLKYNEQKMNSVGNPWGGKINYFYDRYFFSTLPKPSVSNWDGVSPLANPRITAVDRSVELSSVDTASKLMVANGFNVNGTSQLAWKKVLSGKSFAAEDFKLKHEQNSTSNYEEPTWTRIESPLRNVFFNNPQTAIYNLEELDSEPRYSFIAMENTPDYTNAFSIDNTTWLTQRQHPSFWQSVRELTDEQVSELAAALSTEIQNFGTAKQRPFFSILELIEEDLFGKAINAVPSINLRQNNVDRIPAHTPAHFSSATLMNALGAFTFVRSDSFKIKAFSQIKDPINGGTVSSIVCEALVQRTPAEHPDPHFGRQFQILDISWYSKAP